LASRVWARGVTNTYTYNNAGDLGSITYSDGTPAVAITYNRQGRLASTTVAGTNETALIYNAAGQLLSESHSAGLLSGLAVTNVYDSYLRRSNLNGTHATTNLLSQSFGYDAVTGRLKTVTDGANSAGYSYLANSPLVEYIYHTNAGALRMTTQKAYDSVNRLTSIANSAGGTTVSSRGYQYSSVNLRTAITNWHEPDLLDNVVARLAAVWPQTMQCQNPWSGVTMKLGVWWSAWKGQRPMKSLAPCGCNSMPRLRTSATRSVERLTRSMAASGMRWPTRHLLPGREHQARSQRSRHDDGLRNGRNLDKTFRQQLPLCRWGTA